MTEFSFDLQRFAEDAGAETATTSVAESTTPSSVASSESTTETVTEVPSQDGSITAGGFKLVTDPQTGRKSVQEISDVPQETTQTEPEENLQAAEETTRPQNADNNNAVVEYSPEELTVALQMGAVDESRIPAQYQAQYQNYKAQQMAHQQSNQNVNGETNTQTNNGDYNREFYKRIAELSSERAMEEVGITAEELAAAEYSDDSELATKMAAYKIATDWHKADIISKVQQEAQQYSAKQAQQSAIYQDIANYTIELKKQEPNFDKIDQLMSIRYQELPYAQTQVIAETLTSLKQGRITPQQCETLKKYYEDTRLHFYAQNNNLNTAPQQVIRPQAVEQPGQGASVHNTPIDYSQLRKADFRGKQEFVAKIFAQNQ